MSFEGIEFSVLKSSNMELQEIQKYLYIMAFSETEKVDFRTNRPLAAAAVKSLQS